MRKCDILKEKIEKRMTIMKKAWIILAICTVLALGLCLLVSWPDAQGDPVVTLPTIRPHTRPTDTTGTTAPEVPGEVRLYVGGEAEQEAYPLLAQRYTQELGVAVTLVEDAAEATVFVVRSQEELAQWQGKLQDLTGAAVLEQLCNPAFALTQDGVPVGVALDVTGYGLIYNKDLLAQVGFTRTDITDFTSLKVAVELSYTERFRLGFYPFGDMDLDGSAFAQLLAGMGEDPAQLRSFVDLYLQNDTPTNPGKELFAAGKVIFYAGGIWEFADLAAVGSHKLDMLPLYTPGGGGIHCISKAYICVNSQAKQQDLEASLAFLDWLVTAQDGVAPVDSLGVLAPFRDANYAADVYHRILRGYLATDPVLVRWEIAPGFDEEKLQNLTDALNTYCAAPNNDNWAAVEALLTQ